MSRNKRHSTSTVCTSVWRSRSKTISSTFTAIRRLFGKAIGGDICANKKTFLLLTALGTADAESRAELLQWMMATDRDAEKIAAVTKIFTRLGVREASEAVMEEQTALALAQLDKLPQNDATETLRELAERLATRKS